MRKLPPQRQSGQLTEVGVGDSCSVALGLSLPTHSWPLSPGGGEDTAQDEKIPAATSGIWGKTLQQTSATSALTPPFGVCTLLSLGESSSAPVHAALSHLSGCSSHPWPRVGS